MVDAVQGWDTDFDIYDPAYIADPFSIWDTLRTTCPVAHTDRRGGSFLPTRYDDVVAVARDTDHFSSSHVGVLPPGRPEDMEGPDLLPAGIPPISADPPDHTWTRRLLLPWFSPTRVDQYETATRALCRRLIDGFIADGNADAAADYAQQIPVRIIGLVLGVPDDMSDTFTGWVRDLLEFADDQPRVQQALGELVVYFTGLMEERRTDPGDDLISTLLHTEIDGTQIGDDHILGTVALTLIAGVDTTWSGIGSSLWHFATHEDDRRRLVADPELMSTALEEILRAYSPVTMARVTTSDAEIGGCPVKEGDHIILNFPAANRDPEQFEQADEVILDRAVNRHLAFGVGIHRCAGSNLARMEMRVALEEWLARIPEFRLADDAVVTWAGGQVRGPRQLPVVFTD